jgi:hypothetical protein
MSDEHRDPGSDHGAHDGGHAHSLAERVASGVEQLLSPACVGSWRLTSTAPPSVLCALRLAASDIPLTTTLVAPRVSHCDHAAMSGRPS